LRTKHKYYILTLVLIISPSVWVVLFSPLGKGIDDLWGGLAIIIVSIIIYFIALYQISKIEKHSEV